MVEMMIIFWFTILLMLGFVAFASKPSPIYGGLSLVVSGGLGCAIVVSLEDVFLGLIVFLIYLGGMLVVFGYTAAMATEEFPESWVGNLVAMSMLMFSLVAEMLWFAAFSDVEVPTDVGLFDYYGDYCIGQDYSGVTLLYGSGGWAMVMLGWVLFMTIYVVLEVVRGRY
uniref:NADH-ubiquinone oxidoreductase chain 6 n=1 Tax=Distoechurus pennatus TaxID=38614 RepID=Q1MWK1_DISPE|nr:NADH dehydrogenase subunit 6 [Distoechurus pennatus]BAE93965.1 NADH dehydrogenase subunit 6 [Distoechurus pennatus]